MPMWHREKSYLTGSTGSSARSDSVICAAIFHPGLVKVVSLRHRPSRITWVSKGTMSFDAGIADQMPRSTPSFRTIHRRNRFIRLQPLPLDGKGKK
jgi:hypothetical protein